MRVRTSGFIALALLAALAATTAGCKAAVGTAAGDTSPTAGATSTAGPSTAPIHGKVTTPAPNSAERAAILKAATAALGMSGSAEVIQLYAQDGAAAVGDIQAGQGKRSFFALVGGPKEWRLFWSTPFGSSQANATVLTTMDPATFTELAAALDFGKTDPNPRAGIGSGPAPTLKCFEAFVRKSAKDFAGASYTGSFVVQAKVAKDSKGVWWGNAIAQPDQTGLESIGVWGKWDGASWVGKVADTSSGNAATSYFPADVVAQLAL